MHFWPSSWRPAAQLMPRAALAARQHDTKRAHKDARDAAKKAAKKEDGQMCEHGVWKCRICFPHKVRLDAAKWVLALPLRLGENWLNR